MKNEASDLPRTAGSFREMCLLSASQVVTMVWCGGVAFIHSATHLPPFFWYVIFLSKGADVPGFY